MTRNKYGNIGSMFTHQAKPIAIADATFIPISAGTAFKRSNHGATKQILHEVDYRAPVEWS
jgi:hypothetical protein